jgi:hypothetical protein
MMTATCPVCTAAQPEGLLCHACTTRLERDLGDVPAIVAELDVTLSRQARIGSGGKSGVMANHRDGYHAAASLASSTLTNVLTTWARDVSGKRWSHSVTAIRIYRDPQSRYQGPLCHGYCWHESCNQMETYDNVPVSPPAVQGAAQLLSTIDAVRRHSAVNEMVDQITDAITQARRTVDRPGNRTIIFVGPCPELNAEGGNCDGEVHAYIPTEEDRPSRMECRTNPLHKWTSIQWLRAGKRILDRIEERKRRGAA